MNTQDFSIELLNFACKLADESGELLRNLYQSSPIIEFKSDNSPVTNADQEIETLLRKRINSRFPEHGIMGEEFGSENLDAEFVWVLDPIDGTMPFIVGLPVFGTLIGIARHGLPWLGVAEFPVTRDRWTGISNQMAAHNGKTIKTCASTTLSNALLTNSSPDFLNESELRSYQNLTSKVKGTQYGGSCMSYCALAAGRTDIAVDGDFSPYDMFATTAIIEGAGGVVSDWNGDKLTLDWHGQIAASGSRGLHESVLRGLNP